MSAVRYLIASDTGAHLTGSVEIRHEMQLAWTLALAGDRSAPWQLIDTTNPAQDIPGIDP